jgi:transposase, IS6 family
MRRRGAGRPDVARSAFAGFRFPSELITVAVRWYLRYGLSYRDVEELLAERGVAVDHVTVHRWVQRFTPLFAEVARAGRHAPGDRWFVDETYVKIAGRSRYLYRAVDQYGQVIDVLPSKQRDTAAAHRFFTRALSHGPAPVEVTTDKAGPYLRVLDNLVPAALHVTEQYANNRVEADHGRLKARLRPMRGLKRLRSAAVIAGGHAFVQDLRRGHNELAVEVAPALRLAAAFTELAVAVCDQGQLHDSSPPNPANATEPLDDGQRHVLAVAADDVDLVTVSSCDGVASACWHRRRVDLEFAVDLNSPAFSPHPLRIAALHAAQDVGEAVAGVPSGHDQSSARSDTDQPVQRVSGDGPTAMALDIRSSDRPRHVGRTPWRGCRPGQATASLASHVVLRLRPDPAAGVHGPPDQAEAARPGRRRTRRWTSTTQDGPALEATSWDASHRHGRAMPMGPVCQMVVSGLGRRRPPARHPPGVPGGRVRDAGTVCMPWQARSASRRPRLLWSTTFGVLFRRRLGFRRRCWSVIPWTPAGRHARVALPGPHRPHL